MKQDRTLKTILISLDMAEEQMLKIIDLLYELQKENETIASYCKLSDYIFETIVETSERIKTL